MASYRQKGIVLLSTLLISLLLALIVFQYIYSTTVESITVRNQKDWIQEELLLHSALTIGKEKGLELIDHPDFQETSFSIPIEEVFASPGQKEDSFRLTLKISDETGKFNLNAPILASSKADQAAFYLQLERLLSLLSTKIEDLSQHKSSIFQFVRNHRHPFLSLRELEQAPSHPSYKLIQSLGRFFTIHHRNRINISTAPLEVIQSLSPSLSEEDANLLREYYLTGEASQNIQKIGNQVDRFTTLTRFAFRVDVELKKKEKIRKISARYELDGTRNRAILLLLEKDLTYLDRVHQK